MELVRGGGLRLPVLLFIIDRRNHVTNSRNSASSVCNSSFVGSVFEGKRAVFQQDFGVYHYAPLHPLDVVWNWTRGHLMLS